MSIPNIFNTNNCYTGLWGCFHAITYSIVNFQNLPHKATTLDSENLESFLTFLEKVAEPPKTLFERDKNNSVLENAYVAEEVKELILNNQSLSLHYENNLKRLLENVKNTNPFLRSTDLKVLHDISHDLTKYCGRKALTN